MPNPFGGKPKNLYTLEEAASLLGATPLQVRVFVRDGWLWGRTVKGKLYVSKSAIKLFLAEMPRSHADALPV